MQIGSKEAVDKATVLIGGTSCRFSVEMQNTAQALRNGESVDDILGGLEEEIHKDNSKDKLLQLKKSIDELVEQERRLAYLADKTKEQKKIKNRLSQSVIPELMAECGMKDMTLVGGAKLTVKSDCDVSIVDEPEFFKFLERRDEADIIKNTMTITDPSPELIKMIKKAVAKEDSESDEPIDTDYEIARKVNTNTLKAYCRREIVKPNADMPVAIFDMTVYGVQQVVEERNRLRSIAFPPISLHVFSYKKTKIK